MSPESSFQAKLSSWIAIMIAFFDLPNPRIFTLFMISSTATFCLGIALILEWGLYSQYHPGYHWIVYYAPCLISLPILTWMFCILFATFVADKDQNLRILPSLDPSISMQSQSWDMHHRQPKIKEGRLVEEKCQLEQVSASTNRLALVPIQPVHDPPSVSIKVEAAKAKTSNDDKSTLKRTLSLSLFGNKSFDHDNIKRASGSKDALDKSSLSSSKPKLINNSFIHPKSQTHSDSSLYNSNLAK